MTLGNKRVLYNSPKWTQCLAFATVHYTLTFRQCYRFHL